jgi:enterochelin esterase-like enzyme
MRAFWALLFLCAFAGSAGASTVSSFVIQDTVYHRARRVSVYEPANTPEARALLVLLDGDSYLEDLGVPAVLDSLIAAKAIPPVVAVMVDNSADRLGDLANRERFATFVAGQLVPWVRARYRIRPGADDVAIGGYSAGGLAAASVAFRHPEVFHRVLSQSGAFWRGNEGASSPAEWLTEQFRSSPRLALRFSIEVGALETHKVVNGVVFIEANRRLRDVLRGKGYRVDYAEVADAKHEPGHWRAALPAALTKLFAP